MLKLEVITLMSLREIGSGYARPAIGIPIDSCRKQEKVF